VLDGGIAIRQANYVLFESASGFAIFEVVEHDEIANMTPEVSRNIRKQVLW